MSLKLLDHSLGFSGYMTRWLTENHCCWLLFLEPFCGSIATPAHYSVKAMAADGSGDEVKPIPSLNGLAATWQACECIRDKLLLQGKFLSWPSPKTVGVINFESMAQNFYSRHEGLGSMVPPSWIPKNGLHQWDARTGRGLCTLKCFVQMFTQVFFKCFGIEWIIYTVWSLKKWESFPL